MSFENHNHDSEPQRARGPRGRRRPGDRGGPVTMRHGPGGRGARRQRRGDVRAAILLLLEESPRNGYQLIRELSDRSDGAWRPSPGSIYPTLQQLEDEGLIAVDPQESGKTYRLTESGHALVNEERDRLGRPWEDAAAEQGDATAQMMSTLRQVVMAVRQVAIAASDDQTAKVSEILAGARRAIYRILAEDE
ncbi:MAG: PadR family transcriptional regulator [Acidimicrobiales bacterium]